MFFFSFHFRELLEFCFFFSLSEIFSIFIFLFLVFYNFSFLSLIQPAMSSALGFFFIHSLFVKSISIKCLLTASFNRLKKILFVVKCLKFPLTDRLLMKFYNFFVVAVVANLTTSKITREELVVVKR